MPQAVYIIWVVVLIVAVLALPVVVLLLHRTLTAARSVARYMTEMRVAGEGIAAHTEHIGPLEQTIETGGDLLETAGAIDEHAAVIEGVLSERASGHS